jgi:hypothetical protein
VLAKIGNTSISSDEFIERFELTPRLGTQNENNLEQSKKDFLHTLIAEKLWAIKAKELNMNNLGLVKSALGILEKMFVRDALYKIEVKDKVVIPGQELIKGAFRNQIKLKVNFLWSNDKDKIFNLYNLLNKGLSFDSLLTEKDTVVEVTFGKMEESIEDSLYNLFPGKYTSPIQGREGDWFIFRVNERQKSISKGDGIEKENQHVKKVVNERITNKVFKDFYIRFFGGRQIYAKGYLFLSLADKVIKIINEKKQKENVPDNVKIYLNEHDVSKINKEFGKDSLLLPFIAFEQNPVSLGQFLDEFNFEGFYTTTTDSIKIKTKLNSTVRNFIEHELLAWEGYNRGLQNLPDVKDELKMWNDYYLAQMLKRKFVDSIKVSENEILDYYKKQNKEIILPQMVNIVEILTDSLDIIQLVLDELKSGKDMHQLAKKYTQRRWTKNKEGEFGFFPVTMYGDIGRIAGNMNIGEVYGPLKVPEGYSIFKLIGKKDERKEELKPFENVKDDVKKNLMAQKLEESVINYTIKLANDYGISINENTLSQLKVNSLVMFAYRYMGFGGAITAVPMAPPFNEWYNPWLKSKKGLP